MSANHLGTSSRRGQREVVKRVLGKIDRGSREIWRVACDGRIKNLTTTSSSTNAMDQAPANRLNNCLGCKHTGALNIMDDPPKRDSGGRFPFILVCFFLLFPLPPSGASVIVVNGGELYKSGGVNCGDLIQFYKDVKIKLDDTPYNDAVAIKFNSESIAGCCWLQMQWHSVGVRKKGAASPEYVDQTILTSSGAVKLSTNPSKPFWHVDSAQRNRGDKGDKKDPCHEKARAFWKSMLSPYMTNLQILSTLSRMTKRRIRASRASGLRGISKTF